MSEQELKPCPFCGEKVKTSTRPEAEHNGGGFLAFIACYCGGYSATAHKMGYGQTVQEAITDAIAKWNTRAPSQPVSAQPVGITDDIGAMTSEQWAFVAGRAGTKPAGEMPEVRFDTDDRSKWTVKDWYSHLGAWENDKHQLVFGSTIAFEIMLEQFRAELVAQHSHIVAALQARAVVMPEPMSRDSATAERGEYGAAMVRGFNACLDEVARLNGKGGV